MPQLDPTWFASQLFWLALSFALLYFLMSRLALPPLQEVLTRRKETISGDIEQAQSMKLQADHARQDYERTTLAAQEKAQQLMNDALAASKASAEAASKEVDKQVAAKLSEAAKKISAKKQELIDALAPASAELAGLVVKQLTQLEPAEAQDGNVVQLSKARKG